MEAVLISSRKIVETAEILVGGAVIRSQRAIKYLGVLIDTRLLFKEHLESAQKKASRTAGSLSRILLNTRGPKQITRKLLTSVVTSQMLFAAPVRAAAAETKSYMRGAESTYRLYAVRVASAFRTVSDDAALVIAGLVPLRELVREEAELRNTPWAP
nr:uncharacterized protein LOC121503172 [Drosophila kikkawai]